MKTNLKADRRGLPPVVSSPPRTLVLVLAQAGTDLLITEQLRHLDVEVHLTTSHGAMAAALFDTEHEQVGAERTVLFVLDLRASCGADVIDARLADYDAVLNAYMMSGHSWPNTLCLVDSSQAHPLWLQTRPHLRATLLADEVETVIGSPQHPHWHESFATALSRCLTS